MGREGENLPLARARRPSAADALQGRRAPRLADYTGGRLSFGNERAAVLGVPLGRTLRARGGRPADARGPRPHQIPFDVDLSRACPFPARRGLNMVCANSSMKYS